MLTKPSQTLAVVLLTPRERRTLVLALGMGSSKRWAATSIAHHSRWVLTPQASGVGHRDGQLPARQLGGCMQLPIPCGGVCRSSFRHEQFDIALANQTRSPKIELLSLLIAVLRSSITRQRGASAQGLPRGFQARRLAAGSLRKCTILPNVAGPLERAPSLFDANLHTCSKQFPNTSAHNPTSSSCKPGP
eukprot:1158166-Pelagomonas_calceolata.AAC.5